MSAIHTCRKRGKCKVELLANGLWTCSHPGWVGGTECRHIRIVKEMLGVTQGPYSTAKRRPRTIWLCGEPPCEETRRRNARLDVPERVPDIMAALCEGHTKPIQTHGKIGLPLEAVIYALAMKVFLNCSYERLLNALCKDMRFFRLAPAWYGRAPSLQTLCTRFADERVADNISHMIALSAMPGKKIDRTILVDSDQMPSMPSANSRNRKFGNPLPAWRPICTMIKRHFGVGDVTGLIGGVDVTLDTGLGSGDGPHLPGVVQRSRQALSDAKNVAADKAYSIRRNFARTEEMALQLYVPEKLNEKRLTAEKPWPESAQRVTLLQREQLELFAEIFRYRSKVEGVPSSSKRRYPFIRLRARKSDPVPIYPKGLTFINGDEIDQAISTLDETVIAAILAAATTAVGCARLNEALMTMLLENIHKLVTLEHLFNKRVDFADRDFSFDGIRLVSESELQVKINPHVPRPLDNIKE